MLKFFPSMLCAFFLHILPFSPLLAEGIPPNGEKQAQQPNAAPFDPFTGKITKNKVRLRLSPSFEGHILKELQKNDLFIVLGETEEFFAVQPPKELKGYVFRTYVLDNVIEGNHVNVRAYPDLDAPVFAQLNSGERVEGSIEPSNNKWLQITLPPSARLYIAKEYVEKIGDKGLMARLEKKKEEANQLLEETEAAHRNEIAKPFDQVNIEPIVGNYERLIANYPEFPEYPAKAKEQLTALQDTFNQKKLAYLESQAQNSSQTIESNKKLAAELQAQKNKVANLQQQIDYSKQTAEANRPSARKTEQLPINIATWIPVEEGLYASWKDKQEDESSTSLEDFYEDQKKEAFIVRGVIDPYNRPVKNRPGDFLLINTGNKLPFAFLYSTKVNLQDLIGHEVSLIVVQRPNNNFAFPAYYVLAVE
jgi:uncharacterized protein YgiM (DUF1202 family)